MTKILVVDDSKMMRFYLHGCLEKAGFEVEEWLPLSAMEVSEYIVASSPDLILSDFQMPGCSGATLARMAHKSAPSIPLIILTAFRNKEMESTLLKLGVKQILSKPIEEGELIQSVKDALAALAAPTPNAQATLPVG